MPVYGNNSYVLACKSDNKAAYTISAPAVGTTSTQISFAFTASQRFTARGATGLLEFTFPVGQKVWISAARISIPNLSGVVNSNTTIGTGAGGAFLYFRPENGVDPDITANNVVISVTALNEWIPISKLSPTSGLTTAGVYFVPKSLEIDVDFRNTDTTVFSGITIYAYLELQVNAITDPS